MRLIVAGAAALAVASTSAATAVSVVTAEEGHGEWALAIVSLLVVAGTATIAALVVGIGDRLLGAVRSAEATVVAEVRSADAVQRILCGEDQQEGKLRVLPKV